MKTVTKPSMLEFEDGPNIDVAGLELETLHGNFSGSELNSDSREYVFVARG